MENSTAIYNLKKKDNYLLLCVHVLYVRLGIQDSDHLFARRQRLIQRLNWWLHVSVPRSKKSTNGKSGKRKPTSGIKSKNEKSIILKLFRCRSLSPPPSPISTAHQKKFAALQLIYLISRGKFYFFALFLRKNEQVHHPALIFSKDSENTLVQGWGRRIFIS